MDSMHKAVVRSSDVIHASTIARHSIRVDATPGRVNEILRMCSISGRMLGQCGELRGVFHGSMPTMLCFA